MKDNINEMIRDLKDTTLRNEEQNWLKTNLAKLSRMLQGQRDFLTVGKLILSELAPVATATRILDVRFHPCSDRGLRMRGAEEFLGGVIGIEENIHELEIAGDDAMSFAIAK